MDRDLERAVEGMIKGLQEYSSDTFEIESGIDRATAERMAAFLIVNLLFTPDGYPQDNIDGAEVGLAYESVIEWEGESVLDKMEQEAKSWIDGHKEVLEYEAKNLKNKR